MGTHTSNRRFLPTALALAFLCAALVAMGRGAPLACAQSGPGYDLSWWTVDGGGGTFSSGGGYSLGGTAGQPDGGTMSGGAYTLAGGFWRGGAVAAPEYVIYLPLVMRNH